eukprot:6209275-Pleurochrysis_carterae.AAC.2
MAARKLAGEAGGAHNALELLRLPVVEPARQTVLANPDARRIGEERPGGRKRGKKRKLRRQRWHLSQARA